MVVELTEKLAIRTLAVQDHIAGNRPFATEYLYERGGKKCEHCGGRGECACLRCTLGRTKDAAPCSKCRWMDHVDWVARTRR
jgi:hypothetical protein